MSDANTPVGYAEVLEQIKAQIVDSRHRAAMAVNSRLIYLYWQIGQHILLQQHETGWGAKVIAQLSRDLGDAFPEMKGFSPRNLGYMRQLAHEWPARLLTGLGNAKTPTDIAAVFAQQVVAELEEAGQNEIVQQGVAQIENSRSNDIQCTDNEDDINQKESSKGINIANEDQKNEIVQQGVAQIDPLVNSIPEIPFEAFEKLPVGRVPWSHHLTLLDKLGTPRERWFYCQKIIQNGWSRKVLLNQLERGLHQHQGTLTHNFTRALTGPQSELAKTTFKDPYFFDFIQLSDTAKEKEIEDQLTEQITDFLLELGAGFAFMGRQYRLEVGGQDYYLDLLFYHIHLRCHIVIELKIGAFKPEYIGKMQFYLAVLDDLVKNDFDNPSIGLILVKDANRIIAEYALRDTSKPIGVAGYKIVEALPENLVDALPSTKELEEKLSNQNFS